MRWLYDIRERKIRQLKHNTEWIKLGEVEARFVEVLANNEVNTWDEIFSYVYGINKPKNLYDSLSQTRTRLLIKIDLNIMSVHGVRILFIR